MSHAPLVLGVGVGHLSREFLRFCQVLGRDVLGVLIPRQLVVGVVANFVHIRNALVVQRNRRCFAHGVIMAFIGTNDNLT